VISKPSHQPAKERSAGEVYHPSFETGRQIGVGATADRTGPSLFTALQEQLGLRLDATRGPAEVLVIDRVERPMPD
jgi:uncharacterized protein (TIGR03435 family)